MTKAYPVIPVSRLQETFQHYTREFIEPDGELPPMLRLKLNHTYRVSRDSRDLAQALHWPAPECDLAEVAGLFHDVGRFEQCRRYGTFADARSVDHGDLGVRIVDRRRMLDALEETCRQRVRETVRWHNKRDLPDQLPPACRRLVSLVRDADKVDIMRIIGEAVRNGDFAENPEVLLNVDPDGPPTPALIAEIRSGASGSYANVNSLIDMKLVGFAWTRHISVLPALELVRREQLLDGFSRDLQQGAETRELVRQLETQMARRLCRNRKPLPSA